MFIHLHPMPIHNHLHTITLKIHSSNVFAYYFFVFPRLPSTLSLLHNFHHLLLHQYLIDNQPAVSLINTSTAIASTAPLHIQPLLSHTLLLHYSIINITKTSCIVVRTPSIAFWVILHHHHHHSLLIHLLLLHFHNYTPKESMVSACNWFLGRKLQAPYHLSLHTLNYQHSSRYLQAELYLSFKISPNCWLVVIQ